MIKGGKSCKGLISHGVFLPVLFLLSCLFGVFGSSSNTYAADYAITISSPAVEIYNMNRDTSGYTLFLSGQAPLHRHDIHDSSGNITNYNEFFLCGYDTSSNEDCTEDEFFVNGRFSYMSTYPYNNDYQDTLHYDNSVTSLNNDKLYYYTEVGIDNGSYDYDTSCPYNYSPFSGVLISGSCENGILKGIYEVTLSDTEADTLVLYDTFGSDQIVYNFGVGEAATWSYNLSESPDGIIFYLRQIAWGYTPEELETFLETNNTTDSQFPYGYGSDNAQNNEWVWAFLNNLNPAQWANDFVFNSNVLSFFGIFPKLITWFVSLTDVDPVTIGSNTYNCPINLDLVRNFSGGSAPNDSLGGDMGFEAQPFNQSWQDVCDNDNPIIWELNQGDPYFPNFGLSQVGLMATSITAFAFVACLYLSYLGIRGLIRSILQVVDYFLGFGERGLR